MICDIAKSSDHTYLLVYCKVRDNAMLVLLLLLKRNKNPNIWKHRYIGEMGESSSACADIGERDRDSGARHNGIPLAALHTN